MENAVDLDFTMTDEGYYDISFGSDGDFTKNYGYDIAILMSFLLERRASESEVKIPQNRRGWIGNEINGFDNFEYGSKLWLLEQARITRETLNNSITYTQDAFQWFIDSNQLDTVVVDAEYNNDLDLIINIQFVRNNDVTLSRSFNLWENTFVDGEI